MSGTVSGALKMHPIWAISMGGADISEQLQTRLVRLHVRDHAGNEADSVEIELDDGDGINYPHVPIPPPGAEVVVWMGYEETGLVWMGQYFLNEIEFNSSPGRTMRVHGESINMLSRVRTTSSENWDEMSVGEIVEVIAGRNGLEPVVDGIFFGYFIEHTDQKARSDMHFLTQLAIEYAAVFKVVEMKAVFARRGVTTSVTGKSITNTTFTPESDILGWRVLYQARGNHKEIVSRNYDYDLSETLEHRVPGDGNDPDRTLPRRNAFPEEAIPAAESEAVRLHAARGRVTLDIVGDAELSAEGMFTLSGFRDLVDGEYKIKEVQHEMTNSGFRSTVEGELPQGAGGASEAAAAAGGEP